MIIENKAKVRTSRNKMQTSSVNKNYEVMSAIAMLAKKVESLAKEKTSNQVNVVNHGCETCGGPHPYYECPATGAFPHENVYAANTGGSGYPSQGDRNLLSYRSNNYLGPPGFSNQNQNQVPNVQNRNNNFNQNQNRSNQDFNNNQNRGFQNQGNFHNQNNFHKQSHGNYNH